MKSFFNKIIDIFSFIFSKLSIFLILLILGVVIYTRLNSLFELDLIGEGSILNNRLNQINQEVEVREGPARIIYLGNVPTDQEIKEVVESSEEPAEEVEIISFEIIEEQTPEQVARMLSLVGLISDPPSLILLLENTGLINDIVPGSYQVNSNILNRELIAEITHTEYVAELDGTEDESSIQDSTSIDFVSFEITEGQTPEEVSNTLQEVGLIQDPPSFILLLENANLRDEIKTGVYRVPTNIKNIDLMETITIATQS